MATKPLSHFRRMRRNSATLVRQIRKVLASDNGGNAPASEQQGECYIPQPFPRKPRRARTGKREHIRIGHMMVTENPFTGPEVPAGVSIHEETSRTGELQEDKTDRHQECHIRQRRQEPRHDGHCSRGRKSTAPFVIGCGICNVARAQRQLKTQSFPCCEVMDDGISMAISVHLPGTAVAA